MKLPRALLERSPEETVRRLCLGLLDEAGTALSRMDDPEDAEALHDFRVALRRLRSLMRAYEPALAGSGAKKIARRVKALASTTNAARDTEVQIEWLVEERDALDEPASSGARFVIALLEARQSAAPSARTLREGFDPLEKKLRKALGTMPLADDPERGATFVSETAGIVEEHAATLRRSLRDAHSAEDAALLHQARIEAKRLRYVIEPLKGGPEEARALVEKMKSLQDVLGEIQDTRVMTETVSSALEAAAVEEARELQEAALGGGELPDVYRPQNPGLLELLKAQRDRRERCFQALTQDFTGARGEAFFDAVKRLADRLRWWPSGSPPKRRFLLSAVPDAVRNDRPRRVEEGFVPGAAIRERVVSEREGRSTRYTRVLTAADGTETRERLTRAAFEQFWPLTAGRRLESLRWELGDAAPGWSVIELPGAGMILAEAEDDGELSFPESVERVLVREVTGSKRYAPEAIARRTS